MTATPILSFNKKRKKYDQNMPNYKILLKRVWAVNIRQK